MTKLFDSWVSFTTWDEAADASTNEIFACAKNNKFVVSSIDDLRAYLDAAIELNFDTPQRPQDSRFADWRDIGATAVLLASKIGFQLTPSLVSQTLVRKQTDYGHENIRRFGSKGLLVRLHDKVARLENILGRGIDPKNESLQDNILDVVGYCAIGCMWEAEVFLLPLESSLKVAS